MSGIGRETIPDVWSGRKTLPNVRGWSGYPPLMSLSGGRPFWMSGSSQEALLDVRVAHPVVRKWPKGPPECSRVVGRLCQMSVNS